MSVKSKKIRLMKKWIAALRSGEYKQGRGMLITTNKEYCCLGVLCDVSKRQFHIHTMSDGFKTPEEYVSALLPKNLRNYLGLGDSAVNFVGDWEHALAGMNDKGKKFTTIANYIEKNILPRLES